MSRLQKFVPAATLLGLSSASVLTGYIASFTTVAVPAIEVSKDAHTAAKQWQEAYKIGASTAPPFAITCATCFAFLAYQTRGIAGRYPASPALLYMAAALIAPSIVPYTILIMKSSTLAPLESKATNDAAAPSDAETRVLFQKWRGQNAVRAALAGTAATLSAFAILAQVV